MRQNLAEEREIDRDRALSLYLLLIFFRQLLPLIFLQLNPHCTGMLPKLMLFVLQVLVQMQTASTLNSAVKGHASEV
jgi:hypothetical protein